MMTTTKHMTKLETALQMQLANIKAELEGFGWSASSTRRYMRDALSVMCLSEVVAFFDEMLTEEREYYARHTVLADDQLDHTAVFS